VIHYAVAVEGAETEKTGVVVGVSCRLDRARENQFYARARLFMSAPTSQRTRANNDRYLDADCAALHRPPPSTINSRDGDSGGAHKWAERRRLDSWLSGTPGSTDRNR
jgi:hypothetical protein